MGARNRVIEHTTGEVGEDLAVCQRTVDAGTHGPEIGASETGFDRRTGQFSVRQPDAVLSGFGGHELEIVGADLVSQTARSAVDADHGPTLPQIESRSRCGIVDSGNQLHLQVVIARPQGAHFLALTLLGLFRNIGRVGTGHAAMLLGARQIGLAAVALPHRPGRAAAEHPVHLPMRQFYRAPASQSCRNNRCKQVGQGLLMRAQLLQCQTGVQRSHTAGDIETDAAARDHATLLRIKRSHAADGKTISPMRVGHGVGTLLYSGQCGDIAELLKHLAVHGLDQRLIGIDDGRHPHPPPGLDLPDEG